MKFLKKKKVPDELPELALEDLEAGNKDVHDHLKNEELSKSVAPAASAATPPAQPVPPVVKSVETKVPVQAVETQITSGIKKDAPVEQNTEAESPSLAIDEKTFFGELQKDLNAEISDFSQFESWYKDKFEDRDVIEDMKEYWEDNKTSAIIKVLGKSFQEKISQKISKLQNLEKVWQSAYFDLIEKEEEIKEQELELKELLTEFVKVCKTKTSDLAAEKSKSKKEATPQKTSEESKDKKEAASSSKKESTSSKSKTKSKLTSPSSSKKGTK